MISHVAGFDDAPFPRSFRGDVLVVGAVYAGLKLEGVLSGKVRRDGRNATQVLERIITASRFYAHLHLVLVQGIAFAGFNVIDIQALHRAIGLPVMVIARRAPDLEAIRHALLTRVRGGRRKWAIIERTGPMEPLAGVYVQRAGISAEEAEGVIRRLAVYSKLPEPLRAAHLIAAGVTLGQSRGRA